MAITPNNGKVQLSIYLDKKVVDHIDELAALMGWSRSKMATELLKVGLAENDAPIRLGVKIARGVREGKQTLDQLREMLSRGQLDLFESGQA